MAIFPNTNLVKSYKDLIEVQMNFLVLQKCPGVSVQLEFSKAIPDSASHS